jgi:3-phosphoshikimate 1-carboxyvinyltransferase
MTLRMLRQWGARAEANGTQSFFVDGGQNFQSQTYVIEPDASSASYFFAAAALTGGRVRVKSLGKETLQGDVAFVDVLAQMGCVVKKAKNYVEVKGPEGGHLRGVSVDMNAISDTVMTLAAIAPFADSPTEIRNVAHIRGKETDRLNALVKELGRLGVKTEERADGLVVFPRKSSSARRLKPTTITAWR